MGSKPGDVVDYRSRVLVVDDNAANRLAFGTLLENPRREVDLAANAREALALTADREYAVLLIDLRMPGMDGAELAVHLRNRPRTLYTPIIFMSAYDAMPNQVVSGHLAGAFDFVLTPAQPEVILRKVEAFEAMHRSRHQLIERIRALEGEVAALQIQLRAAAVAGPPTDRNPSSAVLSPIENPLAPAPPGKPRND
jgi:CheY-like chemotaxis protein